MEAMEAMEAGQYRGLGFKGLGFRGIGVWMRGWIGRTAQVHGKETMRILQAPMQASEWDEGLDSP